MPIYIATVYVTDPNGVPQRPMVTREAAENEGMFKVRVMDFWIARYGVDAEPSFGPISLSKKQDK